MLHRAIDIEHKTLLLEPEGRVTDAEFELLNQLVGPLVGSQGIDRWLIHCHHYPHWHDFFEKALCCCRFSLDIGKQIRLAIVTDDRVKFDKRLSNPAIESYKHFSYDQMETARNWLKVKPVVV